MTLDSAYLMSMEKSVGTVEVGKYADTTFLDKNLLDIPTNAISSFKVPHMIFDGNVIYGATTNPRCEEAIEDQFNV